MAEGIWRRYYAVGGSTHEVSPASFGVIASWVHNLLGMHGSAAPAET